MSEKKGINFQVYLIEYNTSLSFCERDYCTERKIYFSDVKLKEFLDKTLVFNVKIQKIEVEDVKHLKYELI